MSPLAILEVHCHRFRKRGFALAALLAALAVAVALPDALVAQVVIKENVAISAGAESSKTLTTNDTLTVASDGLLKIQYTSADMIFSDLEEDATLDIALNGSPWVDDTVAHHNDSVLVTTYFCQSFPVQFGDRFEYYFPSDSAFVVGPVEEGDKITFDYDGQKVSSYYTQNTGGSNWTGAQGTQGDPIAHCPESPFYPLELVEFSATIIPDTLNLKFNPPADSDIYPEPGLNVQVTAIVTDAGNNGQVEFQIENFDYPDTEWPDTLIYFLDETDTTLTLEPVDVVNDTARATLVTKDTWGQVIVTAIYSPDVVSKTQDGPTTTQVKLKIWPEDNDLDGLPDRWEIENAGGADLQSVRFDQECALLNAIGGVGGDWCWDKEESVGINNKQNGDGLTKLAEFQGINIGATRYRLDPTRKEIFLDISAAVLVGGDVQTAVEWAAQTLGTELDIETFYAQSISGINIDGNTTRFPGTNRLKWRGGNRKQAPLKGYVRVEAPLYGPHPMKTSFVPRDAPPTTTWSNRQFRRNAFVANFSIYYWNSTPLQSGQPEGAKFGGKLGETAWAPGTDSAFALAEIYRGTIGNIFDGSVNRIDESTPDHLFEYSAQIDPPRFEVGKGDVGYWPFAAYFNNADVDGDGTIGSANPFDLLFDPARSNPRIISLNDKTPNTVTGMTELDLLKRTTLHGMAHAVGIWVPHNSVCNPVSELMKVGLDGGLGRIDTKECHPEFGLTAMRGGIGPAKSDILTSIDKALMKLRRDK